MRRCTQFTLSQVCRDEEGESKNSTRCTHTLRFPTPGRSQILDDSAPVENSHMALGSSRTKKQQPKTRRGKNKNTPPKNNNKKTRRKELYSFLDLYRPLRISSEHAPHNHDILLYHASISHRRITQEWRKRTRRWMKESEKSISLREFKGASWVQHSGFQDLISKPVSRAMVPARARGLCCHHALARVCAFCAWRPRVHRRRCKPGWPRTSERLMTGALFG